MTTDPRLDRLEGTVQEMSNRLTSIETRIASLETSVDNRFNNLETSVNSRFNSLENRITAMWVTSTGTTIAGLVALFVALILTRA